MGTFLYMRPDEMWSLFGSVAASSSTPTDTDYEIAWLVDGRCGRPVKSASVDLRATITASAGVVDLVALCNTNLTVSAAISGGVTGTVPTPTTTENGIALGSFVQVTASSSATSLVMTVTANGSAVTVGELIAGKARTLTPGPPRQDQQRVDDDYLLPDDSEFSSMPYYDRGVERRGFGFTQYYSLSQFDDLQAWQRSQKAGSRPTLIIPNSTTNDAWCAYLAPLKYKRQAAGTYAVTMEFIEYPRSRW